MRATDLAGAAAATSFALLVAEVHGAPSLQVTHSYVSLQEDSAVNLTDTITVRHDDLFHHASLHLAMAVSAGSLQPAMASAPGVLVDYLESSRLSVKGSVHGINAFLRNMLYLPEQDTNFLNSFVPTLRIDVSEFDQRNKVAIGATISSTVRFYVQPVDDLPVLTSSQTLYATPEDTVLLVTGLVLTDLDASEYLDRVYVLYVNTSYGTVSIDAGAPNAGRLLYQSDRIEDVARVVQTLRYLPRPDWSGLDHLVVHVTTLSGPFNSNDGKSNPQMLILFIKMPCNVFLCPAY
ncbi:hypothetical protein EON64_00870 [archaeon]|nr:MAG: hypothetical protein EON64_00870 [archaeon]